MVQEQPYLHTPLHRPGQRPEKHIGRVIPGHNVNFHMHIVFGLVHSLGHCGNGFLIVGMHAMVCPRDRRHGGEGAVELNNGSQLWVEVHHPLRVVRHILVHVNDLLRRRLLHPVSPLINIGRTHR